MGIGITFCFKSIQIIMLHNFNICYINKEIFVTIVLWIK